MNDETRATIVARLHERELELLQTKGREYTGGAEAGNERDVLHNFKDVAAQSGTTPLQAWAVYFLKHVSSITTHIADPSREMSESINGRIEDARTYLGLLQCLIAEQAEQAEQHVAAVREAAQQSWRDGQERAGLPGESYPLPDRAELVIGARGCIDETDAGVRCAKVEGHAGECEGGVWQSGDLPPVGFPDQVVEST